MLNLRLVAVAILVALPATAAAGRAAQRAGLSRRIGSDVVSSALLWFVVSARLTWLALHPATLAYPVDVVRVTQGLDTAGGVAGATVALLALARRLGMGWRALAAPAAVGALAAAAAWHAACPLQNRCGGVYAAPPLGLPLGADATQVPVALLLAACAAALATWVWRGLNRPPCAAAARALASGAVFLAALNLSRPLQLRLAGWPTTLDVPLAAAAAAYAAAAVVLWRRARLRSAAAVTPAAEAARRTGAIAPQREEPGADEGCVGRWKTTMR